MSLADQGSTVRALQAYVTPTYDTRVGKVQIRSTQTLNLFLPLSAYAY